jgi:hypothetical protein
VKAQSEDFKWVKKGDKFTTTGNGGMKAERHKKKPPGGAPLMFNRSVTIKPA